MRALVSGASVAGPVVAYWLARHGHEVTVVERTAADARAGGHAVDLFRPALDVVTRMGVGDAIRQRATGMDTITAFKAGSDRPVEIDLSNIFSIISDDHVEIMRDDLSQVLRAASADHVEYLYGTSIEAISGGDVRLQGGVERTFDLVVGADGMRSNVRRLVFGGTGLTTFLGTYLGVATIPDPRQLERTFVGHLAPRRLVGLYSTAAMTDARLVFLFRPGHELTNDVHDPAAQKALLRAAYSDLGPQVGGWLDELDLTETFYFEPISQVHMPTWSRRRVTLVGDAGYCPGPAVGGGTSLAVVGAYVLAGELAESGDDLARAFSRYEAAMARYIDGSRRLGRRVARVLVPTGRAQVSALFLAARGLARLPTPLARAIGRLDRGSSRLHDSVAIRDYGTGGRHMRSQP